MAEIFEDDELDDKEIDYLTFKKNQLNLFKHDFREAASLADDRSYKIGFDVGFKACKGLARKLGRLKGTLFAIHSTAGASSEFLSCLDSLQQTCEEILSRLLSLKISDSSGVSDNGAEFSLDFARSSLPDYNCDDMEFLLGRSTPSSGISGSEVVGDVVGGEHEITAAKFSSEIAKIQIDCDRLFEKCCPVLHRSGICDQFLHDN